MKQQLFLFILAKMAQRGAGTIHKIPAPLHVHHAPKVVPVSPLVLLVASENTV